MTNLIVAYKDKDQAKRLFAKIGVTIQWDANIRKWVAPVARQELIDTINAAGRDELANYAGADQSAVDYVKSQLISFIGGNTIAATTPSNGGYNANRYEYSWTY